VYNKERKAALFGRNALVIYGGKRSALDVIFYDHEPLELEYDTTQAAPECGAAVVFDPFCWLQRAFRPLPNEISSEAGNV
jgi:hypothetical protein